jgi:hypothetical protein
MMFSSVNRILFHFRAFWPDAVIYKKKMKQANPKTPDALADYYWNNPVD